MTSTKRSRLWAPLTAFVAGTAIAAAVAIGHTWADALITEVIVLVVAAGYYALSAGKSDVSAVYGYRSDERQQLVAVRAQALAFRVMLLVALIAALIMVARNDNYWQSDLIGSVGGVAFLLGLIFYGARESDPHDTGDGIMAGRHPSDTMRDPDDSVRH
jgi:hypothetical protein